MPENVLYALSFGWIPLIFVGVGVAIAIKGWRVVYRGTFAGKKVTARCVDMMEAKDELYTVYKPVYEFEENGRMIRASKIDYDSDRMVQVGAVVQITVEKKHPEVVIEENPNLSSAVVQLIFGLTMAVMALQFVGPVILMLFLGLLQ